MVRQKDIGSEITVHDSVRPTNDTGTAISGESVDRTGFLSCKLKAGVGAAVGGSLTSSDVKLQDSPDDSAWADITAAKGGPIALTQMTSDNEKQELNVNLSPLDQFVRAVQTTVLSAGTLALHADIILGGADIKVPTEA